MLASRIGSIVLGLGLTCACLLPKAAAAQENAASETPSDVRALAEQDRKFAWIHLSSGAWIKGKVHTMRDGTLEFSAEGVDDGEYGWGDVVELYSPFDNIYARVGLERYEGHAQVVDDTVTITTASEVVSFPRSELMAIVRGELEEIERWSAKFNAGLSLNQGNTDQVIAHASGRLRREDAYTRGVLRYDGMYGEANGVESRNRHFGSFNLDVFLTPRLYLSPVIASIESDKFINIEARVLAQAGLGYRLLDEGDLTWELVLAAGYQYLSFISVAPGDETPLSDVVGSADTSIKLNLGSADVHLAWNTVFGLTNAGLTHHKGNFGTSVDFIGIFDLDVDFTFTRFERPRRLQDGTLPKQNDYALVVSLSADFGYD